MRAGTMQAGCLRYKAGQTLSGAVQSTYLGSGDNLKDGKDLNGRNDVYFPFGVGVLASR